MNIRKLFQHLLKSRSDQAPASGHGGTASDRSSKPRPPERPARAPMAPPPASRAQPPAQGHDRLDLQRAVIHHLEWCVLFNERLHRANSLLTETEAHLPDAQESGLGQWLACATPQSVAQQPVFARLRREHLRLHELADQALSHARNGRMDLASTLLNTDFERSRTRVLEALRSLKER